MKNVFDFNEILRKRTEVEKFMNDCDLTIKQRVLMDKSLNHFKEAIKHIMLSEELLKEVIKEGDKK